MIRTLRNLDDSEKRQLIKVLSPSEDLVDLDADEMYLMLKHELRSAVEVPVRDDLPEVMRRRLVEVAVTRFEATRAVDMTDDDELAGEIVGFLLAAAHRMLTDDVLFAEFVTFLRTKEHQLRTRWLSLSTQLAEVLEGRPISLNVLRERLEQPPLTHEETARAVLTSLSLVRKNNPDLPQADLASPRVLAGVPGGVLAPILSAVAGGLYMAGRSGRDLARHPDEGDPQQARAKRARRSKLVQNVVTICVFVVVNGVDGRGRS